MTLAMTAALDRDSLRPLVAGYRGMYDGQFDGAVDAATLESTFAEDLVRRLKAGALRAVTAEPPAAGALIHHPLDWDSALFGLAMERIDHVLAGAASGRDAVRRDLIAAYLADAAGRGVRHVSVRVGVDDADLLRDLTRAGFVRMGEKVMLSRSPDGAPAAPDPEGVRVRPLAEADTPTMAALAGRVITVNRFSSDPALEGGKAPRVYESWFRNLAADQPARILVAEIESAPHGFAACSLGIAAYGDLPFGGAVVPGFIGLIGVDAAFRGRGAADALLRRAVAMLSEAGATVVYANTDAANPAARGMFERLGFTRFSGFAELRWAAPGIG